jgi:hypothetical protein
MDGKMLAKMLAKLLALPEKIARQHCDHPAPTILHLRSSFVSLDHQTKFAASASAKKPQLQLSALGSARLWLAFGQKAFQQKGEMIVRT